MIVIVFVVVVVLSFYSKIIIILNPKGSTKRDRAIEERWERDASRLKEGKWRLKKINQTLHPHKNQKNDLEQTKLKDTKKIENWKIEKLKKMIIERIKEWQLLHQRIIESVYKIANQKNQLRFFTFLSFFFWFHWFLYFLVLWHPPIYIQLSYLSLLIWWWIKFMKRYQNILKN